MARAAEKLTIAKLDKLRSKAQADPSFEAYVADAEQPGLHAWARRGRVRFVFTYRRPGRHHATSLRPVASRPQNSASRQMSHG